MYTAYLSRGVKTFNYLRVKGGSVSSLKQEDFEIIGVRLLRDVFKEREDEFIDFVIKTLTQKAVAVSGVQRDDEIKFAGSVKTFLEETKLTIKDERKYCDLLLSLLKKFNEDVAPKKDKKSEFVKNENYKLVLIELLIKFWRLKDLHDKDIKASNLAKMIFRTICKEYEILLDVKNQKKCLSIMREYLKGTSAQHITPWIFENSHPEIKYTLAMSRFSAGGISMIEEEQGFLYEIDFGGHSVKDISRIKRYAKRLAQVREYTGLLYNLVEENISKYISGDVSPNFCVGINDDLSSTIFFNDMNNASKDGREKNSEVFDKIIAWLREEKERIVPKHLYLEINFAVVDYFEFSEKMTDNF